MSQYLTLGVGDVTGAGGGGPDGEGLETLPGTLLYLNTEGITGAPGSNAAIWVDSSSGNNDALQATPAAKPTIVTGSLAEPARRTVTFDGTDDFMETLDVAGMSGNQLSITMLVNLLVLEANKGLVVSWTFQTDGRFAIQQAPAGEFEFAVAKSAGDGTGSTYRSDNQSITADWHVITCIFDDPGLVTNARLRLDSGSIPKLSLGTTPTTIRDANAGTTLAHFPGIGRFAEIELAAVWIGTGVLSVANQDLLEDTFLEWI